MEFDEDIGTEDEYLGSWSYLFLSIHNGIASQVKDLYRKKNTTLDILKEKASEFGFSPEDLAPWVDIIKDDQCDCS